MHCLLTDRLPGHLGSVPWDFDGIPQPESGSPGQAQESESRIPSSSSALGGRNERFPKDTLLDPQTEVLLSFYL